MAETKNGTSQAASTGKKSNYLFTSIGYILARLVMLLNVVASNIEKTFE